MAAAAGTTGLSRHRNLLLFSAWLQDSSLAELKGFPREHQGLALNPQEGFPSGITCYFQHHVLGP